MNRCVLLILTLVVARASGAELAISGQDTPGAVKIVLGNTLADIYVDANDVKLVNIAAGLLSDDVQRVTGKKPAVVNEPSKLKSQAIIIGSMGHSALVDQLIASGKLNATDLRDRWETYKLTVVDHPLPNVESALVIVGSDRRATAFGVFTLSEAIGVSPWYWWADVTPIHRDALVAAPQVVRDGPPSVKYRGIFINDEDWGLQPWAAKTFDPQQKDIGPKTYEKVFELMLRLKLNYIWPAMHEVTTEFGKIERNITLADEWGIVAGASHPEAMNRNNADWPTLNKGEWRYDTNRNTMLGYWEEWAKKRGPYEALWTLGMRGVHDAPMLGPADMPSKVKLLESAINDQRDLLRKYVNPDILKVPQIFCPYKEALQQYRAGMKVPDDVTICWTEDNFGYIRQLSNPEEQKRGGGSGVYYHISYLGSFSYVWVNTTPPALIWEEMSKAYAYGADRVWVLNVGDIKPGEVGMQFWAKLGWDINSYSRATLPNYLVEWGTGLFGKDLGPRIASVMDKYYRQGFARKPESLSLNPGAFSVSNYDEAARRLAEYIALEREADALAQKISPQRKDAYYELVLYPLRVASLTNQVFLSADFNKMYAAKNDPRANAYANRFDAAMAKINLETDYYNNTLQGGKWRNMMTVKGTSSERWGFKWPTPVRIQPDDTRTIANEDSIVLTTPTVSGIPTFAEKDGYVSIEAEHFTRNIARGEAQWQIIPGLGRSGDSVAVHPVTVASIDQPQDIPTHGPMLEYDLTTTSAGDVQITTYCLPTRRINDARGLRYALAIDDEQPQVIDFNQLNEDAKWQENIRRNAAINTSKHKVGAAGKHTLKVWMVDPGVVMDKIVIDLGGVKESYFGPPETLSQN